MTENISLANSTVTYSFSHTDLAVTTQHTTQQTPRRPTAAHRIKNQIRGVWTIDINHATAPEANYLWQKRHSFAIDIDHLTALA